MNDTFQLSSDFDKPENLSERGEIAYNIFRKWCEKHEWTAGGCTTFYAGEDEPTGYGSDAHLAVIYDGGDLSSVFGSHSSYHSRSFVQEIEEELKKEGMFIEYLTHWGLGVYDE